jgi:hypothetical protein
MSIMHLEKPIGRGQFVKGFACGGLAEGPSTDQPLLVTCPACLERAVCTSCKLRIRPCQEPPGHSIGAAGRPDCQGWVHRFNDRHHCGGSPMNVAMPWPETKEGVTSGSA